MPAPSDNDLKHLDQLALAHYIIGGLAVLFACFPLIHLAVGIGVLTGALPLDQAQDDNGESFPAPFFGWLFTLIGGLFFILGQAIAISIILSGRFMNTHRRYLFSFITGCILCAIFPIGTVLGVFTVIVLSRDSVKVLYNQRTPSPHHLTHESA
ncbi:MAG: hypothetical protein AAGF10_05525 [Verrucomicrobiota bacterium]